LTAKIRGRGKILIQLNFSAYPIQSSLGVLGRKWALLVLMNIALGRATRFNELRRSAPGMSKRILAIRLRELELNGFLVQTENEAGRTHWEITPKGADVLPVLLTLIHFGSKWHADGTPIGGGAYKPLEITISRSNSNLRAGSPIGRTPVRTAFP
jgi:DNA-binding HxlR family transcriptional regulator